MCYWLLAQQRHLHDHHVPPKLHSLYLIHCLHYLQHKFHFGPKRIIHWMRIMRKWLHKLLTFLRWTINNLRSLPRHLLPLHKPNHIPTILHPLLHCQPHLAPLQQRHSSNPMHEWVSSLHWSCERHSNNNLCVGFHFKQLPYCWRKLGQ